MITTLPAVLPAPPGKPKLDPVAELQTFARQVARDGIWGPELAHMVSSLFDQQAGTWNTEHSVGRFDPVIDALDRGGSGGRGRCLEVGSGTGQITPLLAKHFDVVVSIDLSAAMLQQAPRSQSILVRCDASRLPFADMTFDAAVLVDTFCFADELARVLRHDAVIYWINQLGEDGPLYMSTEDIGDALPGAWDARQSSAGWGTWAALRRALST
jgi:SAM-dependent methyltransferase